MVKVQAFGASSGIFWQDGGQHRDPFGSGRAANMDLLWLGRGLNKEGSIIVRKGVGLRFYMGRSCLVLSHTSGQCLNNPHKRLPELTNSSEHASLPPYKMPNTLSLDFKSSALIISLVLVPIVILFAAVAVALICSERCSCRFPRPAWLERLIPRKRAYRLKRNRSDPERGTEASEAPLDYAEPVQSQEHV